MAISLNSYVHRKLQKSLYSLMESKNPLKLFDVWYKDANKNPKVIGVNTMRLATVNEGGKPSVQVVSLSDFSANGFKIMTFEKCSTKYVPNYGALVMYWELLNRQIRIEGVIEKISSTDFIVKPEKFEFWQHQSKSMHDRVLFFLSSESNESTCCNVGEDGWVYQWLEP